ncbi:MAG: glycoside hydrolase family 88 protein [Dysgonamonadaceae bacterium]|jgi:rhamnogalacturonyl hydrolase YesR|nr:glycoside hydrolase family 88 protein [Dysgonamonadaceae bacterium]
MKRHSIPALVLLFFALNSANAQQTTRQSVLDLSEKVAEWQTATFNDNLYGRDYPNSWVAAPFYIGLFDYAELSKNNVYFEWLKKTFNRTYWQVAARMYHADDVCVSQAYIDMFNRFGETKMIIPTLARIDWVIDNPSRASLYLDEKNSSTLERWSWCDALFMAPPVYSRLYAYSGDEKYMAFMDREFKATYNLLFDTKESLFYRDTRYFPKKEKNGKKVFWGRGNGWVAAGLAEILKSLPQTDHVYRPFYEHLFVRFAERLAALQTKDGSWHASLLDPDNYPVPESSATGFITYAIAYGINNGYLSKNKYLPVALKGWKVLTNAVEENGKVGWVQPIGADPQKVTRDMTELYGTGAFLLAACEIYLLLDQ